MICERNGLMRIKVDNLSFGYDYRTVLKNISFSIESGDFLVIVGNNGSGKSTLIKCLLGLNKVPDKRIFLDDIELHDYRQWINIGYVPQRFDDFNYEFPITVNEILTVSKLSKVDEDEKLSLLDRMGILELQNDNINNLSGGQLQRVFITRALMNNPRLLILDEPTAGVDAGNIESFYRMVNDLNSDGVTIILISHDLKNAKANFTHIMHLDDGRAEISNICDIDFGGES